MAWSFMVESLDEGALKFELLLLRLPREVWLDILLWSSAMSISEL